MRPTSAPLRTNRPSRSHLSGVSASASLLFVVAVVLAALTPAGAATRLPAPVESPGAAGLVDPFVGTGSAAAHAGAINTFPGAVMPFGMVQWSPDTAPDRSEGGGYTYADHLISGFSLTHLSGPGCPIFGDVPILPVTGALPADPEGLTAPFSHADEHASPGRYEVTLGSPPVTTRLAVTERSGIGEFTFPASTASNLLFKASGSATGTTRSSVQVVGDHEVLGSVTSGGFCGVHQSYTVYFFAVFEQPFTGEGVWNGTGLHAGAPTCTGSQQQTCGAWLTFDTRSDPTVTMKVGVSYVSTVNAGLNLRAEDPGWNLDHVETAATGAWNAALGRITVHGGALRARRTFTTALYHSLLDPSIFSDVNGQYVGLDDRVHTTRRVQYANFSEWDIYRTELPLLSLIESGRVSDMMQSLVNDATQSGSLPVWELANSNAGTMDGDSADPIIAEAYALGIRGFDVKTALSSMVAGATRTLDVGGVLQRPFIGEFNRDGYVQAYATGQDGTYAVGASITLEYAIDDFSVAQLARATGHPTEARLMMRRAQDWQLLFNPATGYLQARQADGSFPPGPAFQPTPAALESLGQNQFGFQEGNAVQYTWSVPQDLGGLIALMGGNKAATSRLDQYFRELNAGPFLPYDWSGNEPDLWAPWAYDFSGAPWRTQQVVHQIATTMYSLGPDGEPGNDDLGALSAWYVWAALGLYPFTPGTGDLVIGSPTFPSATLALGNGRRLRITTTGAPDTFVRSGTVTAGSGGAVPLHRPWLPAATVRDGATIHLALGAEPNKRWGAGAADAPPSYRQSATPLVGFTLPSGALPVPHYGPGSLVVGIESTRSGPSTVSWFATPSAGVSVTPASGRIDIPAPPRGGSSRRVTTTVRVREAVTTGGSVRFSFVDRAASTTIPPVVVDLTN